MNILLNKLKALFTKSTKKVGVVKKKRVNEDYENWLGV